ncbi:MAG: hypothetical protein JWO78_2395 [Micavibrio sp.]|nr:hypothetical protein [Micavibrio sp.]
MRKKLCLHWLRPFRIASFCLFTMVGIIPSFSRAQDVPILSWWEQVFAFDNYDRQEAIDDLLAPIIHEISPSSEASLDKRVARVRQFISGNSVNIVDEQMYSYWSNMPRQLEMLRAHSKNPDKPLPHMECAMRTVVMYELLKKMGITSRIIIVYPDTPSYISHTYLEIYDPKTARWSIQDPLLNIYWRFKNSDRRASTADLLKYPIRETFVPCHARTGCNYTTEIENMLGYFAMAQIADLGSADNPVMFNPARYDSARLDDFFSRQRFYCDILVKGCSQDVISIQSGSMVANAPKD